MVTKTAATLTREEILDFQEKLKARQYLMDQKIQLRLEKAHQVAVRAADLLKREF